MLDILRRDLYISIHAPRAGSDSLPNVYTGVTARISIHAPRAGSDIISTSAPLPLTHFNPRSPCGERLE